MARARAAWETTDYDDVYTYLRAKLFIELCAGFGRVTVTEAVMKLLKSQGWGKVDRRHEGHARHEHDVDQVAELG